MSAGYDRVWALAIAEGESKVAFIGRESGALEKRDAANVAAEGVAPQLALSGHTGAITGIIAASADEVTTCSTDATMRVWNTAAEVEGKREGKVTELPGPARCMVQSGESVFVGLANGDVVKVEGGAVVATLSGHRDAVASLAVSETTLFSASYDYTVRGWDLATAAPWFVFRGHDNHVKGLAVVNGTSLVTCGRDDKCLVFNVPAEGPSAPAAADGGGDAEAAPEGGAADAAEGGEGKGGDGEGGAAASSELEPITVEPVGVFDLPATPHGLTLVGTQLVATCADGSVRGIASKALLKSVADYTAAVEASCKQATRQINANTAIKVKNAKKIARKAIKAAKAEIAAEEAAAKGEAPKPAEGAAEGDEEEAAADAAAEEGDEENAGPALSEEGQKRLDAATEAANAEAKTAMDRAEDEKKAAVAKLAPLKSQRFTHAVSKFATCAFASTFRGPCSEAALLSVADGNAVAFVAAGAAVAPVAVRIGVQAL